VGTLRFAHPTKTTKTAAQWYLVNPSPSPLAGEGGAKRRMRGKMMNFSLLEKEINERFTDRSYSDR
jgi:hypothetical protein